ncbi:hypothetical protein QWZ08_10125 [Ferruginibacter paludis]|uniref:hypothetical protein n=1 Tax=Ferruginibacter paludis TaxID=1310417 RepID=UPI0025B4333D|nr:hypothetical protein [Ferruginibacter paludis]MDN3655983.1 hypothetical protein [Ferruginibacter paludis]
MDIGTSVTAILIVIACIIPFVIMNKINARRERQFLQPLFNLAEHHQSRLSQYDTWSHSAIGIDHTNGIVFFFKKINNIETSREIRLSAIKKCRVIHVSKTVNDGQENFKGIARLTLAFEHLDNTKADELLEFYNADSDGESLTGELQLVEKWRHLIDNKMNPK